MVVLSPLILSRRTSSPLNVLVAPHKLTAAGMHTSFKVSATACVDLPLVVVLLAADVHGSAFAAQDRSNSGATLFYGLDL
jgi:hypothetical protein